MKGFLLGAAALVALQTQAVSAQTIAGTYSVDYNIRMMRNGEPTAEEPAKVKLVLEQKGDSVFGTWQMTSPREGQAQTLRGTASGNTIKLIGTSNAVIRGNGEERNVAMTQEYTITVDGDVLKGEVIAQPAETEGRRMIISPRPFSGKREK